MIERRLLVGTGAAVLLAAAIAGADILLVGSEFPLNQTTTGSQIGVRGRAVAVARDESVVVWQSDDGDSTGIFGRRFDSGGGGAEFPVNTVTAGAQVQASVSLVESEGFVIAWSSAGSDGDGYGVAARRYDAAGTAQGTEFTLNSYVTANQESPSVAMAADGSFLVAWESFLQDGDQDAVVARAFDAAGAPLGSEVVVNTYATGDQLQPSATALDDGTFAVAWESQGEDGDGNGVFARLLDGDGAPLGPEIPVNAYTTGNQQTVRVSARGAAFVVSWSGESASDGDGVSARLFAAGGAPAGGDTQVNEFTTGPQGRSAVAGAPDGSFVVVWDSSGQDGDGYGVLARRFRGDGSADDSEFQVNSYTTGFQGYTNSVATDGAGRFVVVWADAGQDTDGFGVFGRGLCTDEDEDGDCDLVCGIEPEIGCFQAAAGSSSISIKDSLGDDTKDQIKWKWAKGQLTALDAFLDPVNSTADYRFCIYDDSTARQPLLDASFEPGGTCGDAPCWKATGTKGFAFADDTGAQDGVTKVKFKAGDTGKAQVQLQARGAGVNPPEPPLGNQVIVQLLASDGPTFSCWQTVYTAFKKNAAGNTVASYKASGP